MKKLLLVLVGIALISGLMAEVNFYGQVRTGAWYYNMDEDFTGGESQLDLTSKLYGSSRVGANFTAENIKGKFELGLGNNNASLRLAYAEYDFGGYSILVGQDYTGFTAKNFSSQVASIFTGAELFSIGLGAAYDGRRAQLKFSMDNGFYAIMMQPSKIDPAGIGADAIDALLPKINLGYNYKSDNLSVCPTLGFNYSSYNKDRNVAEFDDAVLAYAFATTVVYKRDAICIKGQINYGQNVNSYGLLSNNVTNSVALWDGAKKEVLNSNTFGGFLQTALKTDIAKFLLGGGFISNKNDGLDDADTAMTVFGQANFSISKNLCAIPEIGMINFMKDGNDNKEGSIVYLGAKLQANF